MSDRMLARGASNSFQGRAGTLIKRAKSSGSKAGGVAVLTLAMLLASCGDADKRDYLAGIDAALTYLDLYDKQDLIIWPAKRIATQYIPQRGALEQDTDGFYYREYSRHFSNLIVYDLRRPTGSVRETIDKAQLPQWYRSHFYRQYLRNVAGKRTCFFERIPSNDSVGAGVIFFAPREASSDAEYNRCISAGRDFINGLPYDRHTAELADLPEPGVRRALLDAMYSCAERGESSAPDPGRSRGGLTERPPPECVRRTLRQFRI